MSSVHADLVTVKRRQQAIVKLFLPLSRSRHVEVFMRKSPNEVAFGLGQSSPELRKSRHPTRRQNVFINYYEVWRTEGAHESFTLDKAYLHVHLANRDGTGDTEVLALHADPHIEKNDSLSMYKRGPHLHFSSAKDSFNKSHVALCLTDVDRVCGSLSAFQAALVLAVGLINDEFIERM